MNRTTIVVLGFCCFTSFTLNAQQVGAEAGNIMLCDTVPSDFLDGNIKIADELAASSKMVFHLYEADSYYQPAYSFILWESEQKINYKLLVNVRAATGEVKTLEPFSDSVVNNVNVDSVLIEMSKVHAIKSDTNTSRSHNHMIRISLFRRSKHIKYSICVDQLMEYFQLSDEVSQLRTLLGMLRRNIAR